MIDDLIGYVKTYENVKVDNKIKKFLRDNLNSAFRIDRPLKSYKLWIKSKTYNNFLADIVGKRIIADIYLNVRVGFKYSRKASALEYTFKFDIKLETVFKRYKERICFKIINTSLYKEYYPIRLYNSRLLINIEKENYQNYADQMLDFYDITREKNGILNVKKLVSKMHLHIYLAKISSDDNVLAKSMFDKKPLTLLNDEDDLISSKYLPKNLIFVNTDSPSVFFYRIYIATICHECVHFHYHKPAFKLLEFLNQHYNNEINYIEPSSISKTKTIMEIQANAIASHLIISDEDLALKTSKLISEYKNDSGEFDLNYMANVINDLKREFNITIVSLKRRLADLGFDDARGALNYVDGKYIDNYLVKPGVLKQNDTFEITESAFINGLGLSKFLYQGIVEEEFVFVDNHVCLNSPLYVEKVEGLYLKLTDYAKRNIEECCIKFKANYVRNSRNWNFLYKDLNKSVIYKVEDNDNVKKRGDKLLEEDKEITKLIEWQNQIFHMDFNEAINFLRESKNLSDKEIAINSGYSEGTLHRYFKEGMVCRDKRNLVALCCGLELNYQLSMCLFDKCNLSLNRNSDEDRVLIYLLTSGVYYTPNRRDDILINYGFDPLLKKRKK